VFVAIPGIAAAIVIAVIEFLWDGWRPHSAVLGRAEGVEGYHDVTRYPNARLIPGPVFRWDAPLFFANAGGFADTGETAGRCGRAGHQRRCQRGRYPGPSWTKP
jgi:MFS superfamily sulfate permease-like transporter